MCTKVTKLKNMQHIKPMALYNTKYKKLRLGLGPVCVCVSWAVATPKLLVGKSCFTLHIR